MLLDRGPTLRFPAVLTIVGGAEVKMATPEASSVPLVSLSNLPATARQRRVAFGVALALLLAFAITAPLANIQLPRYDGYIPAIESMVFVNDLITAILLFAHYAIRPSRAILALASAYL